MKFFTAKNYYLLLLILLFNQFIPTLVTSNNVFLPTTLSQNSTDTKINSPKIESIDACYYIDSIIEDQEVIIKAVSFLPEKETFYLFTHGQSGKLLIDGIWKDQYKIAEWIRQKGFLLHKKTLNIYGCEFAKDEKGKQAVSYLETILGVSIAASDDLTGKDGDWELEIGNTFSALSIVNYQYTLQDEICENGIDDDMDGFTDCADTDCNAPSTNTCSSCDVSNPTLDGAGKFVMTANTDYCITTDMMISELTFAPNTKLCIAPEVTVNVSVKLDLNSISNTDSVSIQILGTLNSNGSLDLRGIADIVIEPGGFFDIAGNINYAASTTKFQNQGKLNVGNQFELNSNSNYINCGEVNGNNGVNLKGGLLINSGRFILAGGNLDNSISGGRVENYGYFEISSNLNVNPGDTYIYNEGTIRIDGVINNIGDVGGPTDGTTGLIELANKATINATTITIGDVGNIDICRYTGATLVERMDVWQNFAGTDNSTKCCVEQGTCSSNEFACTCPNIEGVFEDMTNCGITLDSPTIIDETCGNDNGKITVNANYVGDSTLQYTWSTENGEAMENMLSNISAGQYIVTISEGLLQTVEVCSTPEGGICKPAPAANFICSFMGIAYDAGSRPLATEVATLEMDAEATYGGDWTVTYDVDNNQICADFVGSKTPTSNAIASATTQTGFCGKAISSSVSLSCSFVAVGCFAIDTIDLNNIEENCCPLSLETSTVIPETCGDGNGKITINSNYTGDSTLQYTWSPEGHGTIVENMLTNVSADQYIVTVSEGALQTKEVCDMPEGATYCRAQPAENFLCNFMGINYTAGSRPQVTDVATLEADVEAQYGGDWTVTYNTDTGQLCITFAGAEQPTFAMGSTTSNSGICGLTASQSFTLSCSQQAVGCFAVDTIDIINEEVNCCDLAINEPTIVQATCDGNNGKITVNTTTTSETPLFYNWSPEGTGSQMENMLSNVPAGEYIVTVSEGALQVQELCSTSSANCIAVASNVFLCDFLGLQYSAGSRPLATDVATIEADLEMTHGGNWTLSYDTDAQAICFQFSSSTFNSGGPTTIASSQEGQCETLSKSISIAGLSCETEPVGCFAIDTIDVINNTENCDPCTPPAESGEALCALLSTNNLCGNGNPTDNNIKATMEGQIYQDQSAGTCYVWNGTSWLTTEACPDGFACPAAGLAEADCDGDGLTNMEECEAGFDPIDPCSPAPESGEALCAMLSTTNLCGDGNPADNGTKATMEGQVYQDQSAGTCYVWNGTGWITAEACPEGFACPNAALAQADCDGDGLTNMEECEGGSDPTDPCSPAPESAEALCALLNNTNLCGNGVPTAAGVGKGQIYQDQSTGTCYSWTGENWITAEACPEGFTCPAGGAGLADADCDGDGLTNMEECEGGSDPTDPCSPAPESGEALCALLNNTNLCGNGVPTAVGVGKGQIYQDQSTGTCYSWTGENWITAEACPEGFTCPAGGAGLANADCDGDGFTNAEECEGGSDPTNPCDNLYETGEALCAFIMDNPESPFALADCDEGGINNITECMNGDDPTDPSDDCQLAITPVDTITLACDVTTGTINLNWAEGTAPYNVSVFCTTQELATTENVDQLEIQNGSSDCDFADNEVGDIITLSTTLNISSVNSLVTITNVTSNFPDSDEGMLTGTSQTFNVTGPLASTFAGISTLANNTDLPGTITIDYIFNGFPQSVTLNYTIKVCQGGNEEEFIPLSATTGDCPPFLVNKTEATSVSAENLKPCCYEVIVEDAMGCTDTTEVCLVEPDNCCDLAIADVATEAATSCGGTDGKLIVTTSGENTTGPWTVSYCINGGEVMTTETQSELPLMVTGLGSGIIGCIKVTDANGCMATNDNELLIQEQPMEVGNIIVQNTACGEADGKITIDVINGGEGLTYTWSPEVTTDGNMATNVAAGAYSVTISNGTEGCSVTASAYVSNTGGPAITCGEVTPSACGSEVGTGSFNISIEGTGPFMVGMAGDEKSQAIEGNTYTASNLNPGCYGIQVTDVNGCISIKEVCIENTELTVNVGEVVSSTCGEANGSTTVSVSTEGTFTYTWSNDATGASQTGLAAGVYYVTVSDGMEGGCSGVGVVVVNDEGTASPTVESTDVSCNGANNGTITITPTEGNTYTICSDGDARRTGSTSTSSTTSGTTATASLTGAVKGITRTAFTGLTIKKTTRTTTKRSVLSTTETSGLQPGSYTVKCVTPDGCMSFETIEIKETEPIKAYIDATNVTCDDGQICVSSIVGGNPEYTYAWAGEGVTETDVASCLSVSTAGSFTLTITDQLGCSATQEVVVSQEICEYCTIEGLTSEDICAEITENGEVSVYAELDCDGDGETNATECDNGTDPTDPCSNSYESGEEACLYIINNPESEFAQADCDGGGISNLVECENGGDPDDPSDDCDIILNDIIDVCALIAENPESPMATADCDGDGVTNAQECEDGTDPTDPCEPGFESGEDLCAAMTLNPKIMLLDCDGDGISNGKECEEGTDPTDPCSNTYASGEELCAFILANPDSPLATADCDMGGIDNLTECENGDDPTDPSDDCELVIQGNVDVCALLEADPDNPMATADCDGDGITNAQECEDGTDPTNPCDPGDFTGEELCALIEANPEAPIAYADCDEGGIANNIECENGDDPTDPNDDSDPCDEVFISGEELCAAIESNPALGLADCDEGGVDNATECENGGDPTDPSDDCELVNDGVIDVCELLAADPTNTLAEQDCDGDGIINATECEDGTDPSDPCDPGMESAEDLCAAIAEDEAFAAADCDGDGVTNATECEEGTDPTDPCDYPESTEVDLCELIADDPFGPLALADCDGGGIDNMTECENGGDPEDPADDCDLVNDGTVDVCAILAENPESPMATLDCDGDGITNAIECEEGTDPSDPCDPGNFTGEELCALIEANPEAPIALADCDMGGIANNIECANGDDPTDPDDDMDPCEQLFASPEEMCAFILENPESPIALADCDNGGINNLTECQNGGDPTDPSDDCELVNNGVVDLCALFADDPMNPLNLMDCDGDGIDNVTECDNGTDPSDPCDPENNSGEDVCQLITENPESPMATADCDGDGETNTTECDNGTNPTDPCSNSYGDGANLCEYALLYPESGLATADCDGGGVDNLTECENGGDPSDPSDDCDLVMGDIVDVCALLEENSENPIGAMDCDDDGETNATECENGTDPTDPCSNSYESGEDLCEYILLYPESELAAADCDEGGVDNLTECENGGDPTDPSDDCDLVIDEIVNVCALLEEIPESPMAAMDCDGDGETNATECENGTDPADPCSNSYSPGKDLCEYVLLHPESPLAMADCDEGGVDNLTECENGTDPSDPSDDCDLVANGIVNVCAILNENPESPIATMDCDGDGITNQAECEAGTDPADPCSHTYTNGDDLCEFVLANPTSPLAVADCDNGGVSNLTECNNEVDPLDPEDDRFDLALIKNSVGAITLDGKATFTITIINQGNIDAFAIGVIDYPIVGVDYFSGTSGTVSTVNGNATTITDNTDGTFEISHLEAGDTVVIEYVVQINKQLSNNTIRNVAEITSADDDTNPTNTPPTDEDSTPDDNPNNEVEDDQDDAIIKLPELDPLGVVYCNSCEEDGKIITGGTISVEPAEHVIIIKDGSDGGYQWFTDGTPGIYTMTYNHPNGYPLSVTCLPQAGVFDPTGTDGSIIDKDGTINDIIALGAADTLGGYLNTFGCIDNPYYMQFDLGFGDPSITNNNLPVDCGKLSSVVCNLDNNDSGLANVLTYLYDCNDLTNPIASQYTNANGEYNFDGLVAGCYRVRFVNPTGFNFVPNYIVNENGWSGEVEIASGQCEEKVTVCTTDQIPEYTSNVSYQVEDRCECQEDRTVTERIIILSDSPNENWMLMENDGLITPTGTTASFIGNQNGSYKYELVISYNSGEEYQSEIEFGETTITVTGSCTCPDTEEEEEPNTEEEEEPETVIEEEDGDGDEEATPAFPTEEEGEENPCKQTTYCIHGVAIELMPVGMVEIWAKDLAVNPDMHCDNTWLSLWHPSMPVPQPTTVDEVMGLPNFLIFTCEHLGNQDVQLHTVDTEGNWNYCETYVNVQDNNQSCPQDQEEEVIMPEGMARIAGQVNSWKGESVEYVEVDIHNESYETSANGFYHFDVPMHDHYIITPYKNKNPLNGVSTFDLVLISKHILGIQPFDSPYQWIAADANRSNTVTTFDMVQLRRLILNIDTEFSNNTSWRFIAEEQSFLDNPLAEELEESHQIENLAGNELIDFVGVKIGDVNGSARPNSLQESVIRTSPETFKIEVQDRYLKAGQSYEIQFSTKQLNQIQGYQFTLNIDQVRVDKVQAEGMKLEHFGLQNLDQGLITVSWNHITVNEGQWTEGDKTDQLFTIQLLALQEAKLSEVLAINERPTAVEAYDENGNIMDIQFNFTTPVDQITFELYQNEPNPFQGRTTIEYLLPGNSEATLTLRDEAGRILQVITQEGQAGINQFQLNELDLPAGFIYYQLTTKYGFKSKKMLRLK